MAIEVRNGIEYRRFARTSILLSATMFFLIAPTLGKEKNRDWQSGKVVIAEARNAGALAIPVGGLIVVKGIQRWVYVIDTESLAYEFLWRSKKQIKLTVGGQVKFAVVKYNKAIAIDDDGKERELSIISMKTKQTGR